MASILVVCTGNICRSPVGERFIQRGLAEVMGAAAPDVVSAGTIARDGASATPEAVAAGAERGVDASDHVASLLTPHMLDEAELVVTMAAEHREVAAGLSHEVARRTFTLKELVRLLEDLPAAAPPAAPATWRDRVAAAAAHRAAGGARNAHDEDVADPLGMSFETYQAMAWELEGWSARLVRGLVGDRVTAETEA